MAKDRSNGVTHYAGGVAKINVYFANGEICCQNCEYLWEEKGRISRCRCRLLKDTIVPTAAIDCAILPDCPIEFESEVQI